MSIWIFVSKKFHLSHSALQVIWLLVQRDDICFYTNQLLGEVSDN